MLSTQGSRASKEHEFEIDAISLGVLFEIRSECGPFRLAPVKDLSPLLGKIGGEPEADPFLKGEHHRALDTTTGYASAVVKDACLDSR